MRHHEFHHPDSAKLGCFVRRRREHLGLRQEELACRLGWAQSRISALEHGCVGLPLLASCAHLAVALEVSLAELLSAAGFDLERRHDQWPEID